MDKPKSMTAFGRDMEISHKHSREICVAIQGMKVVKARKYLQDVVALKQIVPFKRYVKESPHRKGIACGKCPKKAASQILKLLESVKANAEQIGKEEAGLYIKSIFTSRGREKRAYGAARALHRRGRHRTRCANIRVTLGEIEGYVPKAKPKPKPKKEPKPKPKEEPKEKPKKEEVKKEEPKTEGKAKAEKEKEKTEKWLKKQGV
jgi:large subunit ribosomal protein L22